MANYGRSDVMTMLSKKYYKVFAELIGKAENLDDFKESLIVFLRQDNERFDTNRFTTAIYNAKTPKYTIGRTVNDILKQERVTQ